MGNSKSTTTYYRYSVQVKVGLLNNTGKSFSGYLLIATVCRSSSRIRNEFLKKFCNIFFCSDRVTGTSVLNDRYPCSSRVPVRARYATLRVASIVARF